MGAGPASALFKNLVDRPTTAKRLSGSIFPLHASDLCKLRETCLIWESEADRKGRPKAWSWYPVHCMWLIIFWILFIMTWFCMLGASFVRWILLIKCVSDNVRKERWNENSYKVIELVMKALISGHWLILTSFCMNLYQNKHQSWSYSPWLAPLLDLAIN